MLSISVVLLLHLPDSIRGLGSNLVEDTGGFDINVPAILVCIGQVENVLKWGYPKNGWFIMDNPSIDG